MKFRAVSALVLVVFVVLFLATPTHVVAQTLTTGSLAGTTTDPTGAVIPGAILTLKSDETGATQTQTTNSSGAYHFALLPPGTYTLNVSKSGYKPATRHVTIAVGQGASANIQMAVEAVGQTVTVLAEAGVLQTENPNVTTTMSSEQVHLVPNGGGDLSYIAQTAPGSTMNAQKGYGNFSTFGLPANSNNFTVNSAPENDPFLNLNNSGATNILLGRNDITEAAVVNNGYSGQYSQAGANVNYVSRSGTNAFHGNAIWYWNGRYVNANNWFNNLSGTPRPFVNDNQWAASFGGPIQKDKTFFFADTEGLRVIIPVAVSVNVPSPAFEAATLANITSVSPGQVGFYNNMFHLWNSAPGASAAANTLAGGGCADFTGGTFGSANPCALNYHTSVSALTTEWLLTARFDHNFGNNDKAFVHYRMDRGDQATYTDPINPVFNVTSFQPQYEGQLQWTHVLSSNTVNSASINGSYYRAIFEQPSTSAALAAQPLQIEFPGQGTSTSGTFWSLGNAYQQPFQTPQGRNVTQYGFVDDLSHTTGNHSLKVGANFARYDITDFAPGEFSLPAATGESLTDFFNGVGSSFTQAFPTRATQPVALWRLGFYGSDDWRVKNNLKLTLTLRADRVSNPVCQTNCFSRLAGNFGTIDSSLSTPYNQTVLANQHQSLASGFHSWNLEPRFGFNWSPFGSTGKTVISGGFGIFSDVLPGGFLDSLITNLPNDPIFTLAGLPLAPGVPGNGLSAAAAAGTALKNGFASGATWANLNSAVLAATSGVSGFPPPNFFNVTNSLYVPRFQEWNLQLQREINPKTSFILNYVGNHGIHEQTLNTGLNAYCGPTVAVTAPAGTPDCLTALGFTSFNGLPALPTDQRFNIMNQLGSSYNSNYNGLTVSLLRRLSSFQFQLNYTYSHALDDASNNGVGITPFNFNTNVSVYSPQNPFNVFQNMYGNADYDVRHYVSANYVWTTPKNVAHGFLGNVLGNWTIGGTIFWHTGLPFTAVDVGTGTTLAGYGYGGVNLTGATLASQTGGFGSQLTCNGKFANPANGACPGMVNNFTANVNGFGNQQRNQIYGPKFFDTDLSIFKNFNIPGREGMSLSVGATAYNLFNHPNFDQPSGFLGSGFGSIVSTVSPPTSIYGAFLGGDASPRLLQSQIKLTF